MKKSTEKKPHNLENPLQECVPQQWLKVTIPRNLWHGDPCTDTFGKIRPPNIANLLLKLQETILKEGASVSAKLSGTSVLCGRRQKRRQNYWKTWHKVFAHILFDGAQEVLNGRSVYRTRRQNCITHRGHRTPKQITSGDTRYTNSVH
jgi:hypothetical protein